MAPQNQAPSDSLQPYLQSIQTDNDTRANAWDVYHNSTDQADFESQLGKLNIPQGAKADLWDSKFGGKSLPNAYAAPQAAAATTTPPTVGPSSAGSYYDEALGWLQKHIATPVTQAEQSTIGAVEDIPKAALFQPYTAQEQQTAFGQGQTSDSPIVRNLSAAYHRDARVLGDVVAGATAPFSVALAPIQKAVAPVMSPFQTLMPDGNKDANALADAVWQAAAFGRAHDIATREKISFAPLDAKAVGATYDQQQASAPEIAPVPVTQMDQVSKQKAAEVALPPPEAQAAAPLTPNDLIAPKPTQEAAPAQPTSIQTTVSPDKFINDVNQGPVNSAQVEKYRADIRAGNPVAPVEIQYDDQGNIVGADGRHRALAAKLEGVSRIPVIVTRGIVTPEADAVIDLGDISTPESTIAPLIAPEPAMPHVDNTDQAVSRLMDIAHKATLAGDQSRAQKAKDLAQSYLDERNEGTQFALVDKSAPLIAPEPKLDSNLDSLAPAQQDIAKTASARIDAATAAAPPDEEPYRQMIESVGGKWNKIDSFGYAHFDAPPEAVGGRYGVSITMKPSDITPENLQSRFAQKAADFRDTEPNAIVQAVGRGDMVDALDKSVGRLADLKDQLDNTADPAKRAQLAADHALENNRAAKLTQSFVSAVGPEAGSVLRDRLLAEADDRAAHAQDIRDAVDQHNRTAVLREQSRQDRAIGHTFEDQFITHPISGETVPRIAKYGPLGRSILDRLMGRVPRVTMNDFTFNDKIGKLEGDEKTAFAEKIKNHVLASEASILRDANIILSRDDVHSPDDMAKALEDGGIMERIQEIDRDARIVGKFPQAEELPSKNPAGGMPGGPGRRPNVRIINPDGTVRPMAPGEGITKARAQQLMESKVRKIPDQSEFIQRAKTLEEQARLKRVMANSIDKQVKPLMPPAPLPEVREGERGAVGEAPGLITDKDIRNEAYEELKSKTDFSPKTSMKTARMRGYDAYELGDGENQRERSGSTGWLKGNTFIDAGPDDHWQVARALLPDVDAMGSGMKAMLENGWVRKATNVSFQAPRLTDAVLHDIEMDTIRNSKYGYEIGIDTNNHLGGDPTMALTIPQGWDSKYDSLKEAVNAELRKRGEAGRVSGTEILGGMAAGMAAGAAHGPIGMGIGGVLGGITPAILRSKAVVNAFNVMKPIFSFANIKQSSWLFGGLDQDAPVTPGMDGILNAQQNDVRGSSTPLLRRLAQIPTELRKALIDKTGMLNDQQTAYGRFLNKLDSRNSLIGGNKVSREDSPFISLDNTAKNIRGEQSYIALVFDRVERTALKAGLSNQLREYLNLKVYERTNDVLTEKLQDLQLERQNLQTKLQSPSLSVRQRIALEDDLKDNQQATKEYTDKINSGEGNPQGYTPQKVALALQLMEKSIDPQKMAMIKDLASQVYDRTRWALDFARDHGLVSDSDYNKFTARGNEYIPSSRIMSDLAENTARWSKDGRTSPAYLRQQQIVKALEGSERVNRDPMVAAQSFINEAISEALRNKVAADYVDAAKQDPKGLGHYIVPVDNDYKPRAANGIWSGPEALIGVVADGKPTTYAVPSWFKESLDGGTAVIHDVVGGVTARFTQKMFSRGATILNVGFSAMQLPTNAMRLAGLSDAGVNIKTFPYDAIKLAGAWASAVKSTLLKDPKWQEALRSGALWSGLERNINPEHFLSTHVLGNPAKSIPSRIIDTVSGLNAALADTFKLTAFNRMREQGASIKVATYEAAKFGGTPDYSRGGSLSPTANIALTFFNAEVQHISQAFQKVGENPKRMVPILGALTAMQLLLAQHNWKQKDENGQPLMRRVPYSTREKDWVILTGGVNDNNMPNMMRLRKPDFVGIFVNPIDNVVEHLANKEERSGAQIASDALSHLVPMSGFRPDLRQGAKHAVATGLGTAAGSVNPILRVPVEEAANKQFGINAPIVANDKIAAAAQTNRNTSPLAQAVGKNLGISPERVDHVLRGFTGGVSDEVQQVAGGHFGKLTKRFTSPMMNQADKNMQDDFYGQLDKVATVRATFQYYMKTDPTKAADYMKQNKALFLRAQAIPDMQNNLSELGNAEKTFQARADAGDATATASAQKMHNAHMKLMSVYSKFLNP